MPPVCGQDRGLVRASRVLGSCVVQCKLDTGRDCKRRTTGWESLPAPGSKPPLRPISTPPPAPCGALGPRSGRKTGQPRDCRCGQRARPGRDAEGVVLVARSALVGEAARPQGRMKPPVTPRSPGRNVLQAGNDPKGAATPKAPRRWQESRHGWISPPIHVRRSRHRFRAARAFLTVKDAAGRNCRCAPRRCRVDAIAES